MTTEDLNGEDEPAAVTFTEDVSRHRDGLDATVKRAAAQLGLKLKALGETLTEF